MIDRLAVMPVQGRRSVSVVSLEVALLNHEALPSVVVVAAAGRRDVQEPRLPRKSVLKTDVLLRSTAVRLEISVGDEQRISM